MILKSNYTYRIGPVLQLYGLTETSGLVLYMPSKTVKYNSVGKVVVGYQMKICDVDTDQPLGPNQFGELRIRGNGVMKGYYDNPEATRTAFDEDGYLRTGDLAYYDTDRDFFIIDRIKEIIKYKGFQVSPVELELILIKHPAVKDAAVIGKPDDKCGELPVALIVIDKNSNSYCHKLLTQELIDYIAGKNEIKIIFPQYKTLNDIIFY